MWEPVLVVTVVFLALRTFFVQSFTVTTGSMEPTLFGERWEHSRDGREGPPAWARALRDRLFSGVSHHFVRAKSTGIVGSPRPLRRFLWLSWRHIQIGDSSQTIWFPPPHLDDWRHAQGLPGGPWPSPGTRVEAGDWLLAGRFVRGERILVDRLSYNFVRPRRGQIVVLSTRGLAAGAGDPHPLEPFAVKRLVGLPGDRLAGSAVRAGHLFLMGDNRTRSLDSRHWGDIAMGRLVGRYWFRYWPLIRTASASN